MMCCWDVCPCSTGGLLISMRTARRQWVRHADSGGPFFIDTTALARSLGFGEDAGLNPGNNTASPADSSKPQAFMAAGLTDGDIMSLTAGLAPTETAAAAADSGGSSREKPFWGSLSSAESIDAVLSSADQEMQAHIAAQSMSVSSMSSRSNTPAQDGSATLSQQDLTKFLKDFELVPVPVDDMVWGLQGAVHR